MPPAAGGPQVATLRGNIGPLQYLALGFGTIIGSAWVILLGNWITKAGPGGAILGFLCGGVVMMVIGACYAELTTHIPEAGSEFIYAHRIYGRGVAFVVGWFLVLYLISVTVFEGLARNFVVVCFVGLAQVRRVGVRNGPLLPHPVQGGRGVEPAGESNADFLPRGQ